jgi:hypothetical protein
VNDVEQLVRIATAVLLTVVLVLWSRMGGLDE